MARPGKRERARVKKRSHSRRVRMWPHVDGADLVTNAIGREHLRRHGRWTARRCQAEAKAWRWARHLGGNRQHNAESVAQGKMAALTSTEGATSRH